MVNFILFFLVDYGIVDFLLLLENIFDFVSLFNFELVMWYI